MDAVDRAIMKRAQELNQERVQAQNRAMAQWLPQTPREPIDWNAGAPKLEPPPPPPTLRDLLPKLTPLQREAAVTLATRCGEPRAMRVGAATGAFEMEWCGTIAWAHEDGSVTGTTKVAHASIEAVELAIKGRRTLF